ncbi:MAG: glycosyltransferase family 4 protein [Candidatus Methanosuratincola sp.]
MVVHAYYPLAETRVERQAHTLIKHGYEVDVICLRDTGEPAFETHSSVNIYRLPVKRHKSAGPVTQLLEYLAFFLLALIRLVVLQIRRRYQVVQVHNLPDFLVFAALAPKLAGARIILDIHDLMPEFYASRFNRSLESLPVRLVVWQEQLSCRFADHVITVSEHWRQTLIQRGVTKEKCSVVMNVADESIFQYIENNESKSGTCPAFRLIYHGTVVERYGLDLAVQAIEKTREEIPGIHLTILGKGEFVETLIQMVQQLDLNEHVSIYNEMRPAEELPQIIRAANLGIVPYRGDTFTDQLLPTKLMEYAALGLPAIAARTTAIGTYFGDTMVELFTPGDVDDLAACILRLYKSRGRLEELAQGCKKFNERFNWTKIGEEYAALVENLAAQSSNTYLREYADRT